MTVTWIQRSFAPMKQYLPARLHRPIRALGTAMLGPYWNAWRSGYLRSCLAGRAVDKNGEPLPWYTYPAIDFLAGRRFDGRSVLELGGGQSTLWWAARAGKVLTLEGDPAWHRRLAQQIPENVDLRLIRSVAARAMQTEVAAIREHVNKRRFDVIVVDGLQRAALAPIACQWLCEDGIVICDNAEGYGIQAALVDCGLARIDFYGNAPGVILPHATSIFFGPQAFVLASTWPIRVPALG